MMGKENYKQTALYKAIKWINNNAKFLQKEIKRLLKEVNNGN